MVLTYGISSAGIPLKIWLATNKQVLEGTTTAINQTGQGDVQSTAPLPATSAENVDTYVSIDTARLIYSFSDETMYHKVAARLDHIAMAVGSDLVPVKNFKQLAKHGFKRGYKVLGVGSEAATIYASRTNFTKADTGRCIALHIQPARLTSKNVSALVPIFAEFFPNGLKGFLSKAHVSEIDIAIDAVGVRLHDLILAHPTAQQWSKFGTMKAGLQTICIGAVSSIRRWRIYDRVAKAKHKHPLPYGSANVIRFELHLKGPFTAHTFQSMPNPLTDLAVRRIEDASLVGLSPTERALVRMIFHQGGYPDFHTALNEHPGLKSVVKFDLFSLGHAPWWKANEFWPLAQAALNPALGLMLH